MSKVKTVQFVDLNDLIEEYEHRKIPDWGIYHDGSLITDYKEGNLEEGADELKRFGKKLVKAASAAIYTLVLYEEGGNNQVASAYNFRFRNEDEMAIRQQVGGYGPVFQQQQQIAQLTEIIKELQKEIQALKDDDDEDDEPPVNSMGNALMDAIAAAAPDLIQRFFGKKPAAAAINGIEGLGSEEKIKAALDVLKAVDPNFADHLYKLSQIAKVDPDTYNFLIKKLSIL